MFPLRCEPKMLKSFLILFHIYFSTKVYYPNLSNNKSEHFKDWIFKRFHVFRVEIFDIIFPIHCFSLIILKKKLLPKLLFYAKTFNAKVYNILRMLMI